MSLDLIWAHAGGGGSGAELTIFFGGLMILGIVMGAAKSVKLPIAGAIAAAGLAGIIGAVVFAGPSAGNLSISITDPREGAEVEAGAPIQVEVSVHDGKIATSARDTDNSHLHIFIDGELDSMPYTTSPEIELDPGEHEITVELVDGSHAPYSPAVRDSITVTAT